MWDRYWSMALRRSSLIWYILWTVFSVTPTYLSTGHSSLSHWHTSTLDSLLCHTDIHQHWQSSRHTDIHLHWTVFSVTPTYINTEQSSLSLRHTLALDSLLCHINIHLHLTVFSVTPTYIYTGQSSLSHRNTSTLDNITQQSIVCSIFIVGSRTDVIGIVIKPVLMSSLHIAMCWFWSN